jgi:chromatin segregation and condensation protein Rec8/ScpA/Scc1 (kleisin family)
MAAMGLLAAATTAGAQEFPSTPKQETMAQAIQYEKYKDAAAAAQAKKDAAEAARSEPGTQTRAAKPAKVRKTQQADRPSVEKPAVEK